MLPKHPEEFGVTAPGLSSGQDVGSSSVKVVVTSANLRTLALSLLLIFATGALYSPLRHYSFLNYDDEIYVTSNIHVKYGLDWDTVKWAFTTYAASNWHPITWLSHALDCQLFYTNPFRHHETNLLLHVLNVLLLFWILQRATGFTGRSFMVAALFALHPVNVESVAWIAERKNLLSMLFLLLALGAYGWYAHKPRADRYVIVAVLFALGLMAKPQVITFPCLLLLWDYWPLQRMSAGRNASSSTIKAPGTMPARKLSWLILEKLPLLALSVASGFVTVRAQRADNAMSNPLNAFPFAIRLGNAVLSYAQYLKTAFWPSHLSILYPHPGYSLKTWHVFVTLFLLMVISALVVRNRRHRYLLVGWFWFLGTLVPMIGLIQVGSQAMADRYAYLPFVGLFIMICWGVAEWAELQHISTAWLAGISMAALLTLAAVTHRQIGYWKDDVTLWSHATQVTSGNWEAENNLGVTLLNEEQADQAIPHFRAAESMSPSNPWSKLYIGFYEQQKGHLPQAIERYKQVISMTQNDTLRCAGLRIPALSNMASVYQYLGDSAHASESSEAAKSESREAFEAYSKRRSD